MLFKKRVKLYQQIYYRLLKHDYSYSKHDNLKEHKHPTNLIMNTTRFSGKILVCGFPVVNNDKHYNANIIICLYFKY